MKMFSIFDQFVSAYMQPFFTWSLADAKKGFSACANDPAHAVGQHRSSYVLYELGDFDEVAGVFKLHPQPLCIGTGTDFYRPAVDEPAEPLLKAVKNG